MRNTLKCLLAATALSATALVTQASAQTETNSQPARTQTPAEALAADAQHIVKTFGVPLDEAVRRLQVEQSTADQIGQLRQTYGSRLAGIFIEHRPDYHVKLRLKGAEPVGPLTLGSGSASVRVDVVTGAAATLQELQSAIATNLAGLSKLLPTMFGITADERTGEIVIEVKATALEAPVVLGKAAAVTELLGHPVRIRPLDAVQSKHSVRGGVSLQGACTTGFVVQVGTSKGPVTSAHCPDSLEYQDPVEGSAHPITATAFRDDASHDVQWANATSFALPQFYADTNVPRVLTGKRLQSSTTVGSTVCHRGATTGYSCGSVESISYTPTKPATATMPYPYYCGPSDNLTCSSTWVQVGGSSLKCWEGDSGGPWFVSQTALGIHTGGVTNNTGTCFSAWYMSTDRLSGLGTGYSLLYGS